MLPKIESQRNITKLVQVSTVLRAPKGSGNLLETIESASKTHTISTTMPKTKKSMKSAAAASIIMALVIAILQLAGKNTPFVTIVLISCVGLAAFYCLAQTKWLTRGTVAERIGRNASSVLIIGAVLWIFGVWVWPYKVVVSPSAVTFGETQHENYIFTVANKTDDDIYSVQVKFTVDSKSLPDPFSIEIPMASRRPVIEGSNLADIRALRCHTAEGKPLLLFGIYRIGPHESREISFTHDRRSGATIAANLIYFAEDVQPRLGDRNRMQETFHIDEKMTCEGDLVFLVDPNGPQPKGITEERTIQ